MDKFIPVNEPLLEGNEKKYLAECIDTGWISSEGPFVKLFEEEFSTHMGRKYGIAVANGTAAIDVAIEALGIGPGDEVILPTFTIISCVHQIVRAGAKPVFIDSDIETWNMDVKAIENSITSSTKAVMVVHIYGLPVDMNPVIDLCDSYGLKLLEDAAEVIGQKYYQRPCGSFGDISTVSFYPNKHITTGEGGMVLTDDENLAYKCRELRNLCFMHGKRFVHERLGWNYRMTNLQAAVGMAQLESLDKFIEKKHEIGKRYNENLNDVSGVILPLNQTKYATNIYWIYGLLIEKKLNLTSAEFMKKLGKMGVGTRPFFYPMHLQPVLKKIYNFDHYKLPNSEILYNKGFYLPSGLKITNNDIDIVSEAVVKILNKF